MIRAYRYKLRPTNEQEKSLTAALETMRRLYNHAISDRRDLLKTEGKHTSFFAQKSQLVKLRAESEYLRALPYCMASGTYKRVDEAWVAFKRRWSSRCRGGETCPPEDAGLPRFVRFGEFDTLCYDSQEGNGWRYLPPNPDAGQNERKNAGVKANPFGVLRCMKDRPIPPGAKLLTRFEITRTVSGWYCTLLADDGVEQVIPSEGGRVVSMILGIQPFVCLSDGRKWSLPLLSIVGDTTPRVARLSRRLQRQRDAGKARGLLLAAEIEKNETLTEDERDNQIRWSKRARSNRYEETKRMKARIEESVHNRRKHHHILIARAIVAGLDPGSILEYAKPEIIRAVRTPRPRVDAEGRDGAFLPNGAERKAERNKERMGVAHAAFLLILANKCAEHGIVLRDTAAKPKREQLGTGSSLKKRAEAKKAEKLLRELSEIGLQSE